MIFIVEPPLHVFGILDARPIVAFKEIRRTFVASFLQFIRLFIRLSGTVDVDHMCRITNTIQTTMSAIISREKSRGSSPRGVKRSPPSVGRPGMR